MTVSWSNNSHPTGAGSLFSKEKSLWTMWTDWSILVLSSKKQAWPKTIAFLKGVTYPKCSASMAQRRTSSTAFTKLGMGNNPCFPTWGVVCGQIRQYTVLTWPSYHLSNERICRTYLASLALSFIISVINSIRVISPSPFASMSKNIFYKIQKGYSMPQCNYTTKTAI